MIEADFTIKPEIVLMDPVNLLPADGEAYFYPSFFSEKESRRLEGGLTCNITWKQEPIIMMGRQIMQPRLTAWYGDAGKAYTYSGITMQPLAWSEDLLFIKTRIEAVCGFSFNSALLNLYRNGKDSMGWHRDNERALGINPVISSVSFGASRTFNFRHFKDKKLRIKKLLTDGSLLVMCGTTQHHWYHSINKEAAVNTSRINITFRKIVDG